MPGLPAHLLHELNIFTVPEICLVSRGLVRCACPVVTGGAEHLVSRQLDVKVLLGYDGHVVHSHIGIFLKTEMELSIVFIVVFVRC